ncbi:MAG: methyl-accepting chemotaxis protein [Alphaproteobacteria bacterium]|nr:methyl-accepting chemotaxis protein [Alphaproteobacteria bacterium]
MSSELDLYKNAFKAAEGVCLEAAKGNLEARIINTEEFGEAGSMLNAINKMLDLADAFVREAGASLECASEGKFYRRFLLRGMLGDFKRGATIINSARESMEKNTHLSEQRLKLAEAFGSKVQAVVDTVSTAAMEMEGTANGMASVANDTHEQSVTVAAAATEATANVESVAEASEQLSQSINEISGQVSDSTATTESAVAAMNSVNEAVSGLAEAAEQIEKVLEFIRRIANQTHMLALNATIEAARAGAAGRGFTVVASEVKTLAEQTANATNDIAEQIEGIQRASTRTAEATGGIGNSIQSLKEISTMIASAVEQQSASTGEISGNVRQVAQAAQDVSRSITSISGASEKTGAAAKEVLESAGSLSHQATTLRAEVEEFLENFRAV